jgi:uncharacterized membrane protein
MFLFPFTFGRRPPMESRVKLAGHAVHPMLIVFPLGLLATAVIFDVIYLVTDVRIWTRAAYLMIAVGVIVGLVAAVVGFIDWYAIPRGTRAWRIGLYHGIGNVIVVSLFAVSWVLRRDTPAAPPTEAVVAALLGLVLALATAWLGGELVDRLGVGVDEGANLNASSSLTGMPASPRPGMEFRGATAPGWSGPDRRRIPQPAYVGVERRRPLS